MLWASMQVLEAQQDQAYRAPSYFLWVALSLLAGGALGWLVAAVLGFTRARVFGAAARWFAVAAVCLVIYHLQWVVLAFGMVGGDNDVVLSLGAFFNLFVLLAAVCAIIGFTRFTNPEP
ncbi:MAG TPA: hypothetical protein VG148_09070 [Pyrinomonadaceae bacterium]|nr:hypothetical protein [Pyrinomonadaceae bacterium]